MFPNRKKYEQAAKFILSHAVLRRMFGWKIKYCQILLNPLHTSSNAKRYKSYRMVKDKFCRTIENATLKD